MDKQIALMLLYVSLSAMFFSYVKHAQQTYQFNGDTYKLAGMMQYNDKGQDICVPVFKRINK